MSPKETSGKNLEAVVDTVFMEHLTSGEYFFRNKQTPVRVLEDVNLLLKRGEAWAVSGRTLAEIKLLLEIMANIRPYDTGRCVLAERGMMRRKRVILNHVFYIGGAEMLYDTMNVLEYLMLTSRPSQKSAVSVQESLFEALIASGLGHVSLAPIRLLSKEEKAVVTLAAAVFSNSLLIVYNLPEHDYDDALTAAVGKLSEAAVNSGKTLVLGTNDGRLIEAACTHAAFLTSGRIIYRGTVEDLRCRYDPVELIVRGGRLQELTILLTSLLPGFEMELKENSLLIKNRTGSSVQAGFLHEKIIETGIVPESIELGPKTVGRAYEELLKRHDLQNELLQKGASPGLVGG